MIDVWSIRAGKNGKVSVDGSETNRYVEILYLWITLFLINKCENKWDFILKINQLLSNFFGQFDIKN